MIQSRSELILNIVAKYIWIKAFISLVHYYIQSCVHLQVEVNLLKLGIISIKGNSGMGNC